MANQGIKCNVCGELLNVNLRRSDVYVCEFCGNEQPRFVDTDFDRRQIISKIRESISKADLRKAAENITEYEDNYEDFKSEEEFLKVKKQCDFGISYTVNKNGTFNGKPLDDGTVIILKKELLNNIDNAINYYKDVHKKTYTSLLKIKELFSSIYKENKRLAFISSDKSKSEIFNLKQYQDDIIQIDLESTLEEYEIRLIKSFDNLKALLIYVDQNNFILNGYVRSLYYRFKKAKKKIIVLYSDETKIDILLSAEIKIKIDSKNLIADIASALTGNIVDEIAYEADGSQIISIDEKESIILPEFVTKIKSRACYNKKIQDLVLLGTNNLEIEEYSFSKSNVETFTSSQKRNVLYFGINSFYDCRRLNKVNANGRKIVIDVGAFKDCGNLKSINFMADEIEVFEHSFENTELEYVDMKNATHIHSYAFNLCTNLDELIISSSCILDSNILTSKTVTVKIKDSMPGGKIENNSFPNGTLIKVSDKGIYKKLKKDFDDYYKIELGE